MKKGLIINAALVTVVATILYIVGLSYGKLEVGAYVYIPEDDIEIHEPEYPYEVLVSTTELDTYGVRISQIIYYEEFNEVSMALISSQAADEEYQVRLYDYLSNQETPIVRTGVKTQLYHTFENLYIFLDESYNGTLVLEVTNSENEVIERVRFEIN